MQKAGSVKTNLGLFLWSWLSSGPFCWAELCSWQRSWNEQRIPQQLFFLSCWGRRTEFPKYSTMCVIFASKWKWCYLICHVILLGMLLLIHKRVRETEWSLKGYGRDVYWINALNRLSIFTHFYFAASHAVMFSLVLLLFFVLGDREASRCWKWDHDEGSRSGETAVTQRQGTGNHKGRAHLYRLHSWAWHANTSYNDLFV